jgi:hypothetical protein
MYFDFGIRMSLENSACCKMTYMCGKCSLYSRFGLARSSGTWQSCDMDRSLNPDQALIERVWDSSYPAATRVF